MIHVILGPPCAGKTTYVAAHMKAGDVRLDFDTLLHAVGGDGIDHYGDGIAHTIAFACRESIIRNVTGSLWRHKSAGVDAWMIHAATNPELLDSYQAAGADFTLMDPGEEACISRARARDGDAADRIIAAIQTWYANPPATPEGTETMKTNTAMTRRDITGRIRLLAADTAAPADAAEGSFDALVSVFNVKDSQGAVIMPGAFKASLAAKAESGSPFPFLWSHRWDDLGAYVGTFTGEETKDGLVIHGQLDLNDPAGAKAHALIKSGIVSEFSIGGFVPADGFEIRKDEAGDLTEYDTVFDLREVSLVLAGANPDTQLIGVKDGGDGGHNGLDVDRLRALKGIIDAALATVSDPPPTPEPSPPDQGEENTKAADAPASGGLRNSKGARALLAAVVEAIGQKEVSS